MTQIAALSFLLTCAFFLVSVLLTLYLTIRSQDKRAFLIRGPLRALRIDLAWPFGLFRESQWATPKDKRVARFGKLSFSMLAVSALLSWITMQAS